MSSTYYKNFRNKHDVTDKIKCDCGGFYTYFSKSKHLKSKKHKHYVETGDVWRCSTNLERVRKHRMKLGSKICTPCN